MPRKLFLSSTVLFVLLSLCSVVSVEAGSLTWDQTYGGNAGEAAFALIETSDGGYALACDTGSFGAGSSDFWLVKTDEFGNMEWNQAYGGPEYERPHSLVETADGGYAIAGDTKSFGPQCDVWLVKTDASGNMEWNRIYEEARRDIPYRDYSLVSASDGGYIIAVGTFLIKTDEVGNMEWIRTYGGTCSSLVVTTDGGYAIAGSKSSSATGDPDLPLTSRADFWLVKIDEFGNMEWNKTYGGIGANYAYSMVETTDGGYALVGDGSFGSDWDGFWLVKTDASGNMQWQQSIDTSRYTEVCTVVEADDGGYAIAGETTGFGARSHDFWLVKTDVFGNVEWNRTYGGTDLDQANAMVKTSDGGYAIAGETASFGLGWTDCWLVKTNENGVIPEFHSWLMPTLLLTATLVILLNKKKLNKPRSSC